MPGWTRTRSARSTSSPPAATSPSRAARRSWRWSACAPARSRGAGSGCSRSEPGGGAGAGARPPGGYTFRSAGGGRRRKGSDAMSQSTEPVPGAGPVDPPPRSRVAFERLRERTDELELIISGLLAFALLTVPGRVFDAWAANSIHVEGVYEYAVWLGFATSVGLGYSLAFAFLVHLATRGYWVALVGLKATFGGIRWERIPMMGAVSRAHYRARIGELGDAIDRADRIASMLFAMAILLALSVAWMSLLAILAI